MSHKDPSIKYQQSLKGLKGLQYVEKHNYLDYKYGIGHNGTRKSHSDFKNTYNQLMFQIPKLKNQLKRQERRLLTKAPTQQQWEQFLKKDLQRRDNQQREKEQREYIKPDVMEKWEFVTPQQQNKICNLTEEYIPKSITMKHLLYQNEWESKGDDLHPSGDLLKLFQNQHYYLPHG